MFNRAKEAYRILTYKNPTSPAHLVPNVVFEEQPVTRPSNVSLRLAAFMESLAFSLLAGFIVGAISLLVTRIAGGPSPAVSMTTISGVVAGIVSFFCTRFGHDITNKIQVRLNLKEAIAPYFGHKLNETIRLIRH